MPATTSEQRLKALEHSKEDPNVLLDEAASIANVEYDKRSGKYARVSKVPLQSSKSFREQWLLRWIVKKLVEVAQPGREKGRTTSSSAFIINTQTWAFLAYLLSAISDQKSQEILLERNFTRVLTSAGALMLEHHATRVSSVAVPVNEGSHSERPRKRIKVSPVVNENFMATSQDGTSGALLPLLQFIQVTNAWAKLLQPESQALPKGSRSVTPAWVDSVKEAAIFIGQVVNAVNLFATASINAAAEELALSTVSIWLQLWHTFANSNNTVDRKTIDKTFNEMVLNPCLELYYELRLVTETSSVTAKKEIERQIALYTVLPLRSIFSNNYAAKWAKARDGVSWSDIEPIYQMFQDRLGAALNIRSIADYQVAELMRPQWAALLIDVGARVIPRDDVRRRQREVPWLEALTLCLAHLAFAHQMPKMNKGPDGHLQPDIDKTPPNLDIPTSWPDELLRTIMTEEVQFSAAIKEYLVTSVLMWRKRPVPITLLAQLMKLDPDIFTPSVGQPNSATCLARLFSAISEKQILRRPEYTVAVHDLIIPTFEAFAKARKYGELLELWLTNLEEALRVRVSTQATTASEEFPVALLWDDDDLFLKFRSICRLVTSPSFGQEILTETINEIRTLSDRIGPTADIFAKLAILESIIQVKGKDLKSSVDGFQSIVVLADLVSNGLKEHNDYQGQRWRLWSMLNVLQTLDSRFGRLESTVDTMVTANKNFHSLKVSKIEKLPQHQRSALLMEQYQIFSMLIRSCFTNDDNNQTKYQKQACQLLSSEISSLAKMIKQETTLDKLWDGRVSSLQTLEQLVTGFLACLLQESLLTEVGNTVATTDLLSPLEAPLERCIASPPQKSKRYSLLELTTLYLASRGTGIDSHRGDEQSNLEIGPEKHAGKVASSGSISAALEQTLSQHTIDQLAVEAQNNLATLKSAQKLVAPYVQSQHLVGWSAVLEEGALILTSKDTELKDYPDLARRLAGRIDLDFTKTSTALPQVLIQLELCLMTLKRHPEVVNQAIVDNLLKDLALCSSSGALVAPTSHVEADSEASYNPSIIFDRLIEVVSILLIRYRRRLAGRNHLLLPVLQNLLKCFFYTPSRTYMYQNAATSRQKQEFRSSLPVWLKQEALPVSSAVKFSKIISSICNPTTASARSAHRRRRSTKPAAVELNDETQKAKRLAAQYMQYFVMEYARCVLDGVVQPEVREKLTPGLYSILDAMDRDLMKAMNSAMDPSSRAIFKGLYDDWVKHWRWDQT